MPTSRVLWNLGESGCALRAAFSASRVPQMKIRSEGLMETRIDHIINVGNRPRPNWTVLGLIGAGVLLVGALVGSAATASGWFKGGDKVPIYVAADAKINEQVTLNGGFSAIAKAITPAVVTVTVKSRARQQQQV